jgi:hypothetical protein
LRTFPEVERVFGKAGRANSSTDPAPFSMMETVISLARLFILWKSYGDAGGDHLSGDITRDRSIGCRNRRPAVKGPEQSVNSGGNDARHLDDVCVPDACLEKGSVKGIQRGEAFRSSGG